MVLGERELAGGEAYDLPALVYRVDAAHGAAAGWGGGAQVVRQVGAGSVRPVALALHTHPLAAAFRTIKLKILIFEHSHDSRPTGTVPGSRYPGTGCDITWASSEVASFCHDSSTDLCKNEEEMGTVPQCKRKNIGAKFKFLRFQIDAGHLFKNDLIWIRILLSR